jgi:hypothetical protein
MTSRIPTEYPMAGFGGNLELDSTFFKAMLNR